MAKKHIGKREWLGVVNGGMGYFVKYCPRCKQKIYLQGGEFEEFFIKVKANIPNLIKLQLQRLRRRIYLPKLRIEWQAKGVDFNGIDDRVKVHNIFYENNNIDMAYKKFNKDYFDNKYKEQGGLKRLEEMLAGKIAYRKIGRHFGISGARVYTIAQAIREGLFTDSLRGLAKNKGVHNSKLKGLTRLLSMIR